MIARVFRFSTSWLSSVITFCPIFPHNKNNLHNNSTCECSAIRHFDIKIAISFASWTWPPVHIIHTVGRLVFPNKQHSTKKTSIKTCALFLRAFYDSIDVASGLRHCMYLGIFLWMSKGSNFNNNQYTAKQPPNHPINLIHNSEICLEPQLSSLV